MLNEEMRVEALSGVVPARLTITLWDFSWYVRTGAGEPFEDLDRCFSEATARGYNAIRICAMPFLLFRSGLDTSAVRLGPLGNDFGRGVRWYDVQTDTVIDARAQLLALFRAAKKHDCYVIVSSWEYQQSPAFSATGDWYEALHAVAPEDRATVLAEAQADLMDLLISEDLDDRVAFTEIHNEVQITHLTEGLGDRKDLVVALKPRLERALAAFRARHPDKLVTVNYAGVPTASMRGLPEGMDVLVVHPYVYGVLGALLRRFGVRGPEDGFDEAGARRELLRPDAPPMATWEPPAAEPWRRDSTVVGRAEVYLHDWVDAEAFDRWLYEHYGEYRRAMDETLEQWMRTAADTAARLGVPLVLGEGWIGYTPLAGRFEEGPVGAAFCRRGVALSDELDAWGTIVCSNAAPHHSMWADIALQVECNNLFLNHATQTQ